MSLKGKTIVTIDDTASIRTFLRVSLEDEGATVHEAGNAADGVVLCKTVSPDFVVLDLGLPDRDGLEILSEIIGMGQSSDGPKIIILTVRKGQDVVNSAFSKGASAYLNKPFMVEDLLDVMEEISA